MDFIEWGIEELACYACGKNEDEAEQLVDTNGVDALLKERYGVNFRAYCAIVKDLLPFTPVVQTAITSSKMHAFVRGDAIVVCIPAPDKT